MKKLLLILIALFSLNTLTYASFPITESPTEQLSECNTVTSVSPNSSGSWWGELSGWQKFWIIYLTLGFLFLIFIIIPFMENNVFFQYA